MSCPVCGSTHFHVKDPEDRFSIFSFALTGPNPEFDDDVEPDEAPEVTPQTETYCNACAWHGKLSKI
ncbi:MAG: hypothetical protein HKM93_15710 [Desulfobacteraceae bacterium]|nr:hypothetical protein [Desulfobacteraceae bacterium]